MTIIPLYKYQSGEGVITVSPVKPEGVDFTEKKRLIADEGKQITDGRGLYNCIDVDSPEGFTEIDFTEQENTENGED